MQITVLEPWYKENNTAVFVTEENKTKIMYWTCKHYVQGGECIYCAIVIEGDE